MQAQADGGVAREHVDERQIGIAIGAFEHVVEISDGLVGMDQEDEFELWHSDPLECSSG